MEEAVLRVTLAPGGEVRAAALKERLRERLPDRLGDWLQARLLQDGATSEAARAKAGGLRLSFEPADIVNEVMSFGAPTPVEVAVSGPKLAESRAYAETVRARLADVPALRDLQFAQPLDYPTVEVTVDREKLGRMGGTVKDVTDSVVAATSSSQYMVPLFWPDPTIGIGFQVQVEIPQDRMRSELDVGLVKVRALRTGRQCGCGTWPRSAGARCRERTTGTT